MTWHCSECGQPVDDGDMVGYFTDGEGRYIPGSLGFWHCNPICGHRDEHFAGIRLPHDSHIGEFKQRIAQFLAMYVYEANTEEFRHDCATFMLRCLVNGYDEAYPYINDAKYEGIIESNLPNNLLWDDEVRAVLNWKKSYKN